MGLVLAKLRRPLSLQTKESCVPPPRLQRQQERHGEWCLPGVADACGTRLAVDRENDWCGISDFRKMKHQLSRQIRLRASLDRRSRMYSLFMHCCLRQWVFGICPL